MKTVQHIGGGYEMRFRLKERQPDGKECGPVGGIVRGVLFDPVNEIDTKLLEPVILDATDFTEVQVRMVGDNYVEVTLR